MKGYRLFLSGHKKHLFNFGLKHFQTELDQIFYICLEGKCVHFVFSMQKDEDNLCCSCHLLGETKVPSGRFSQYDNYDYVAHT